MKIDITLLKEHPLNHEVYGNDDPEQFNALVEKIRNSGYIKPILITTQFIIISGHRRVRAALLLGYTDIEFQYVPEDPQKQIELFLLENYYREKSMEQKTSEAKYYMEIEARKSEERKRQAGNQNLVQSPVVEKIPPPTEKGKTRDIVGQKYGMSGKTLEKSLEVVDRIDSELDDKIKWFFSQSLDENVDATNKLAKKPVETVQEVMERTGDDPKKVSSVLREMDKEQQMSNVNLPDGKFQVIYCDITQIPVENLLKFSISPIYEEDAVLFLWVTPEQLEKTFYVIHHWNFKYKTCLVWNRDFLNEVSDMAEILLVSVKGNPPMIHQSVVYKEKTEKPEMVKQMIQSTYPTGKKIELFVGESIEGWELFEPTSESQME